MTLYQMTVIYTACAMFLIGVAAALWAVWSLRDD